MAAYLRERCAECSADLQGQTKTPCHKCGCTQRDKWWWYRDRVRAPEGTKLANGKARDRIKGKAPLNTKVSAEQAEHEHRERLLHPDRVAARMAEHLPEPKPSTSNEPTIAQLIDLFVPAYNEGSAAANRSRALILRADVRRHFGSMCPSEIDQGHLDRFRDELRKLPGKPRRNETGKLEKTKAGDQTVRNKCFALAKLLGWAAAQRKLRGWRFELQPLEVEVAPTKAVRAHDDPEVLPVPPKDVERLLRASWDARYTASILLAADCGLRIGEIIGAQWTDIRDGAITIRRSIDPRNVEGPPKGKITRVVPLSTRTIKALAKVPKRGIWILTRNDDDPAARRNVKRASPPGGHVGYSGLNKAIKAVYRKAGIKFGWDGTNTINVWHSLRHAYGTRLVAAGVHGEEIQRLMGHKDYRTTQRYVRVTRDQLAATVRRVFG